MVHYAYIGMVIFVIDIVNIVEYLMNSDSLWLDWLVN